MSSPSSPPQLPPPSSAERDRARQKVILKVAIGVLVAGSLAVAILPRSIPLPARLFVSATDLAVAGVLVVLFRQKFSN